MGDSLKRIQHVLGGLDESSGELRADYDRVWNALGPPRIENISWPTIGGEVVPATWYPSGDPSLDYTQSADYLSRLLKATRHAPVPEFALRRHEASEFIERNGVTDVRDIALVEGMWGPLCFPDVLEWERIVVRPTTSYWKPGFDIKLDYGNALSAPSFTIYDGLVYALPFIVRLEMSDSPIYRGRGLAAKVAALLESVRE